MEPSPHYHFGEFRLDAGERLLYRGGELVPLAPKILETLQLLVEQHGRMVTKDLLLERVWPDAVVGEDALLRNISLLRKALGDSEGGGRFIETIPKRGYRFVAPVTTGEPARDGSAATSRADWKRLAAAGALVAAMGLAAFLLWPTSDEPIGTRKVLLVVLPFQNLSGDPEQEYFADGMTEETIAHLAALDPRRLSVIARTTAMRYKGTPKTVAEIGRELGVDYVLEGSVRNEAGRSRIVAQLIEARGQTHLFARTYDQDFRSMMDLQDDVAAAVAREVRIALSEGSPAVLRRRPANPQALDAYWRGRFHWNQRTSEGLRKGLEYFQQAHQADPDYALALVGIADSYNLLAAYDHPTQETLPLAQEAAREALKHDSSLAEAHASLAYATFHLDYDWDEVDRGFRRAVTLNTGSSTVHQWYAEFLAAMGRHEEAAAQIQRALELDPLSLAVQVDSGRLAYFARRYDQAVQDLRRAVDANPRAAFPRIFLAIVYAKKGMSTEAIAEAERVAQAQPSRKLLLAYCYAAAGRDDEARKILKAAPPERGEEFLRAGIHGELGETDAAMDLLERAYREKSFFIPLLMVHPWLDAARPHPRFAKLLERLHFKGSLEADSQPRG